MALLPHGSCPEDPWAEVSRAQQGAREGGGTGTSLCCSDTSTECPHVTVSLNGEKLSPYHFVNASRCQWSSIWGNAYEVGLYGGLESSLCTRVVLPAYLFRAAWCNPSGGSSFCLQQWRHHTGGGRDMGDAMMSVRIKARDHRLPALIERPTHEKHSTGPCASRTVLGTHTALHDRCDECSDW